MKSNEASTSRHVLPKIQENTQIPEKIKENVNITPEKKIQCQIKKEMKIPKLKLQEEINKNALSFEILTITNYSPIRVKSRTFPTVPSCDKDGQNLPKSLL